MDTIQLKAMRAFANGQPWTVDADGFKVNGTLIDPAAWQATYLKLYAAQARQSRISGGMTATISGKAIPVWCDAESRSNLQGTLLSLQSNPNFSTGWKGSDGKFYPMAAADLQALATAVLTFVNDAFSREQNVAAQIDAGTITTPAQIDAIISA